MGEPSDEPHAEQGAGVAPEAGVGLAHPSRVQFSHSKTDVTALSSDLHPSDVPGEQRLLSRESGRCEGDLMGVRARRRALPRARSATSQQEQRQRQPPRRRSSYTPRAWPLSPAGRRPSRGVQSGHNLRHCQGDQQDI
jgi:hypothetical protein